MPPTRLAACVLGALLLMTTGPVALASGTTHSFPSPAAPSRAAQDPSAAPDEDPTSPNPVNLTWASQPGDRFLVGAKTGKAVLTYGHQGCKRVNKRGACTGGNWETIPDAAWISRAKRPSGPHPDTVYFKTIKTDLNLDCTMQVLADSKVVVERFRWQYGRQQVFNRAFVTSPTKVYRFPISLTPDKHYFTFTVTNATKDRNAKTNPSGIAWKISGCSVTPAPSFNSLEVREAIERTDLEAPHAMLRFGLADDRDNIDNDFSQDQFGDPVRTSDGLNYEFEGCSGTLVGEPGTALLLTAGHCVVPAEFEEDGETKKYATWNGTAYFGASVSPSGRFQYLYRCTITHFYSPFRGDDTEAAFSSQDWALAGLEFCEDYRGTFLDYPVGTPTKALRPYPLGDYPIDDETYNGFFATYPVMPDNHEPYSQGHLLAGAWRVDKAEELNDPKTDRNEDNDFYLVPGLLNQFTPTGGNEDTVGGGASGSGLIFDPSNPKIGGILTDLQRIPDDSPDEFRSINVAALRISAEMKDLVREAGRNQWPRGTVYYEH